MVRKDRCYSLERWKTLRLAHMLRQTQTLEFDDLDAPEGNEVVRPKMKRLVEFDILRGVFFTARVKADAPPQLTGPLHPRAQMSPCTAACQLVNNGYSDNSYYNV
jgi:hypothetical protein